MGEESRRVQHPRVVVLGYSEASMLLHSEQGSGVCAVVSIVGDREHAVECDVIDRHLVLRFDDIDVMPVGDRVAAWQWERGLDRARQTGLNPVPPSITHAREIVEFAESVRDAEGVVLFQCHGGVSRSSAAALIALAVWTGSGFECYCMEEVKRVRPAALPHPGLVRFGDEVLGRSGALVDVVREV